MTISELCRSLTRQYGKSEAVLEQCAELRTSLELKTCEYLGWGFTRPEAENEAIKQFGDVHSLFKQIGSKKVYKVRIDFCANLIATSILFLVLIAICALIKRFFPSEHTDIFIIISIIATSVGLSIPLVMNLSEFAVGKNKTQVSGGTLESARLAFISWFILSVSALIVNFVLSISIPWVIFVSLGFFDWPLSLYFCSKLFESGYFDAPFNQETVN